jgi:two-component system response regulator PilR (NtrC family)
VRIIAATNRELQKMVEEGGFREDLFYRLNVMSIPVPPLRERTEDIPLIAEHFLKQYSGQMNKPVHTISAEAMNLLQGHPWRGNVRELQNAIERAVALERTESILPESLPDDVRLKRRSAVSAPAGLPELGQGFDLEAKGEEFYRHYIMLALERADGVQVKAAELLGMSFRSFRYYVKKYNLK